MIAAAVGVAGAIAQQGAAEDAVRASNRAKLKNHERNNWNYLSKVTLDNARWKNDVSIADVKFDQAYQNMVDQWRQEDAQLDKIFAKHDFRVEKAIRKMYKNDYAGTQTGNTAARLAGKSAREMGYEQAESLNELMFDAEEIEIRKDVHHREAEYKQWEVYDKIRFAPIHGHAPPPPLLDVMPSRTGLFLNILGSAFGAATGSDAAPSIGSNTTPSIGSNTAPSGQQYGPMASDIALKENIKQISISPSGLNIYEWNYLDESIRYRGVIAQDLISKGRQDAVTEMDNGYLGVHYDKIDVNLTEVHR